jgi:hypothetical protein
MWQYLIVWVVTAVLSALLAPRPKTTTPKPGQVEAPVAASDGAIPVLFGTRMIKQPNCVWFGDVRTTPIRVKGGGKK